MSVNTIDGVPPWLEQAQTRREPSRVAAPTPDHLWTVNEVARYLNASRSWVYERTMAGDIPSLRLGNLRRYDPAKISEYANRVQTGRESAKKHSRE